MAATKTTLVALTGAALALPGLLPNKAKAASPILSPEADFNFAFYNEGGNRMEVEVYQLSAKTPINNQLEIFINGVKDTISGASPMYNAPEVTKISSGSARPATVSCASPPCGSPPPSGGDRYVVSGPVKQVLTPFTFSDERHAIDLGGSYFFNDYTLTVSGGLSHEKDYISNFGGFNIQREFNQKNTVLSAGFNYADDTISPVNRPGVSYDKTTQQYLLGLSQVVNKLSVWQTSLNFSVDDGYLTDPYKQVYVLDLGSTVYENRPGDRYRWSIFNRFIQHIPLLNASVHFDYRYAFDSWRVDSHMMQITWFQPLGDGWQLAPNFRYYTQNAATFYRPYFNESPNEDAAYSSDYRLAQYGAMSGGIKLKKNFDSHLKLEIGFDYYRRQSDWAFNGNHDNDFADYSFTLTSATLSYKF